MIPYFQALFIQRHGMITALMIYGRPPFEGEWRPNVLVWVVSMSV